MLVLVKGIEMEEIIFKIVLLGDGMVGKTSLRYRYLDKGFTSNYLATLGADFAIKELNYMNYHIRFQIWDLAGQFRFETLRKNFYIGAQSALILYDVTNRESFNNVKNWLNEFWTHNGKGKMPVVLIGNKIDLRSNNSDDISTDEGITLAKRFQEENKTNFIIPYVETSPKTGENIDLAFRTITDHYLKLYNT